MSYRQRLFGLPAPIGQPVECNLLRIEHRNMRWPRRLLKDGQVEDRLLLRPDRSSSNGQRRSLPHKSRCVHPWRRDHHDRKFSRPLMNLRDPHVTLQVFRQGNCDCCRCLFRFHNPHTEPFQLRPKPAADFIRVLLAQGRMIRYINRHSARARGCHNLPRQLLLGAAPVQCKRGRNHEKQEWQAAGTRERLELPGAEQDISAMGEL